MPVVVLFFCPGELGGEYSNLRIVSDNMLLSGELELNVDEPARDSGDVEEGELPGREFGESGEVGRGDPRECEIRRGEVADIRSRDGVLGVNGDTKPVPGVRGLLEGVPGLEWRTNPG